MTDIGSRKIMTCWTIGLLALGGLSGLLLVFEEAGAYTTRNTIIIEGDANFTSGNGVTGGSGTELDPYVIDGWEIDGGGEGRCIYVANTTKHFVISNCNLTNASGNANQYYRNAGISIYNATNITIDSCVFSGNGHGIYLDTSSGFKIGGNQFENCDYGVYVYTDQEDLNRDYTILDIAIRDNEFDMTSNNDAVYFYIELDYNGNSHHDVNIGNIDITENDFYMNGTSAEGIHIQDIDVFELVDGNISMGDVSISGNRIFGGSKAIYFDGYFYYYTNVTLNVGNVTVNGNLLLNQSTECIYLNYYDVEDMYGTSKASLGDLAINENRIISYQKTVNGINVNDYACWAYLEDDACIIVGDIFVEDNVIDVDGYGAYVYYSYAAFDMRDESSVTMGNASIRNNTIFNSSYGIYLKYSYTAGVMIDNASAIFGDTAIIDNLINSTSDAIFFDYYHISYDMNDNAIAVFGGLFISDNRLDTMSKGIYFDNSEYRGYEMEKSSSFLLGEIFITRNQIDSRNSAIYLDYRYFGYAMYNDASMSTGDIKIFDNQLISNVSETIYLYIDESARNLKNDSAVIMGNISLINNSISSSSHDGLSVEYSCGGVGSDMEGNSYARLPGYFITGNTFDVDREGIVFDLYYMGNCNHDNTFVDIGEILIENNTFTDGTYGVHISIYEILGGYNSTIATLDGIVISNNEFLNITNDAIYIFFDEFGDHFRDNEVLILGDIWITDNLIEGCDDGVHVDYSGLFSGSFANVTIGDLYVLDNMIRDCSNYGVYVHYDLDADDYSNLTVGNATISGNVIENCSNEGIYLYILKNNETYATAAMGNAFIMDNDITNCAGTSHGIYLRDVEHATISENVISDCYNGIYLLGSHNSTVLRNIARSNRKAGLYIQSSNDNTVGLSSFTLNRDGVIVDPSANTEIHNCSMHNNTDYGLNTTDNGGLAVNSSENWWGSESGPFHPINNSGGAGDNVTNGTDITNWLTAPILFITSDDLNDTLEDELFSVDYEALDVDGNPLNWSLNTSASWLSMDTDTGVLSGIPNNGEVGSHSINITVVDGYGGEDHRSFSLNVLNVNDAPNITTDDVTTVAEDMLYNVDYNATDIDPTGDVLTWSLNTTATWLSLNSSTGMLSGIPTNEKVGIYRLNVSVSDGNNGIDWHNFTLMVTNVNDAPVITNADVSNATEDELYSVIYEAGDIDPTNDTLTWGLDTNAAWLSMNVTSGNLSGTPANADVGDSWVNVSCRDDKNGTGWTNYTLSVSNVNDAPTIITTDNVNATQYRLYTVDYEATDIDPTNDTLSWDLETNASWLSINSTFGMLLGTPTDAGEYTVKVMVEDGNGGADSHEFALTVIKGNQAPAITTSALPKATEGKPYSFNVQFSDLEGDTVTWEMTSNANWLSIDPATGILSGTPPIGSVGEYWANISVRDSNGGAGSFNFTLTVVESETSDIIPIRTIEVKDGEVRFFSYTDNTSGVFLEVEVAGNGTLVAAKVEDDSDMVGEDPDEYARISFYLQLTFTGEMDWTNITISFADITLNESLDYSKATIFYFDDYEWREANNTGVDLENRVVWANVSHYTIFAAFAKEKTDVDQGGEEGEGEPWYKSSGVIITVVVIISIIILLGVFFFMRKREGVEETPEDDISEMETEEVITEDEEEIHEEKKEVVIAEEKGESKAPVEPTEEGIEKEMPEVKTEEPTPEEKRESEAPVEPTEEGIEEEMPEGKTEEPTPEEKGESEAPEEPTEEGIEEEMPEGKTEEKLGGSEDELAAELEEFDEAEELEELEVVQGGEGIEGKREEPEDELAAELAEFDENEFDLEE